MKNVQHLLCIPCQNVHYSHNYDGWISYTYVVGLQLLSVPACIFTRFILMS